MHSLLHPRHLRSQFHWRASLPERMPSWFIRPRLQPRLYERLRGRLLRRSSDWQVLRLCPKLFLRILRQHGHPHVCVTYVLSDLWPSLLRRQRHQALHYQVQLSILRPQHELHMRVDMPLALLRRKHDEDLSDKKRLRRV